MKRILLIALPVIILSVASCKGKEEIIPATYDDALSISGQDDTLIPSAGGEFRVVVKSNLDYSVNIDQQEQWLTVLPASKAGSPATNGLVRFMATAFDIADEGTIRQARITFSASGVNPASIDVSQYPADTYRFMTDEPSQIKFGPSGGTCTIPVDANVKFTVLLSDRWMTTVSGPGEMPVVVQLAENSGEGPRTGTITIDAGKYGSDKIEITQSGKPAHEPGIANAQELLAFASAWNNKEDISAYTSPDGSIKVLSDLDLSSVKEWTPIGNVTSFALSNTSLSINEGRPFEGIFDGGGHTIKGFAQKYATGDSVCGGLFGVLYNAQVRDLNFDSSCTLEVNMPSVSASGLACGFLAGIMRGGTVSGVTVSGTVLPSVIKKESSNTCCGIGGLIGCARSDEAMNTITECTFDGEIKDVESDIFVNSSTSMVAGIVAMAIGPRESHITGCVNRANISTRVHRVAGIVSTSTGYLHVVRCKNYGNIYNDPMANSVGARVGGILALDSNTTAGRGDEVTDCENHGIVAQGPTAPLGACAGGVVCITRDVKVSGCRNYGTVVMPPGGTAYGLLTAQVTDNDATFASCKVRGAFATGYDPSTGALTGKVEITASNYWTYAGNVATGYSCPFFNSSNITFLEQ